MGKKKGSKKKKTKTKAQKMAVANKKKYGGTASAAAANRASSLAGGPAFAGTVREWYETLVETIIDAANTIHRKTLRGSANFIVV